MRRINCSWHPNAVLHFLGLCTDRSCQSSMQIAKQEQYVLSGFMNCCCKLVTKQNSLRWPWNWNQQVIRNLSTMFPVPTVRAEKVHQIVLHASLPVLSIVLYLIK